VRSERYPVLWVGQAAVISAPVEIDVGNAAEVEKCLLSVLGHGGRVLVVDMTTTTFCDCAGAYAIMACWKRAGAEGSSLRLAVRAPAVSYVFSITGASRLIDIYPTVAAALAGPGGESLRQRILKDADQRLRSLPPLARSRQLASETSTS
jgi:anti-sigma B factor antagonist